MIYFGQTFDRLPAKKDLKSLAFMELKLKNAEEISVRDITRWAKSLPPDMKISWAVEGKTSIETLPWHRENAKHLGAFAVLYLPPMGEASDWVNQRKLFASNSKRKPLTFWEPSSTLSSTRVERECKKMNIKSTWDISEVLDLEKPVEISKTKSDVKYVKVQAIGVHARKTHPMWARLMEALLPFDGNERSHVYVAIEGNGEVVKTMAERVKS